MGGLALALHVVVVLSGDLYSAIAAHAAYDFFAGVLYVRWIRPRTIQRDRPDAGGPHV